MFLVLVDKRNDLGVLECNHRLYRLRNRDWKCNSSSRALHVASQYSATGFESKCHVFGILVCFGLYFVQRLCKIR